MQQPSPQLKKLLQHARASASPPLSPKVLLLCRLAAGHAGLSVKQWLEDVLRLAAVHAMPVEVRMQLMTTAIHGIEVEEFTPVIDSTVALAPSDLVHDDFVLALLERQLDVLTPMVDSTEPAAITPAWAHPLLPKPYVAPPDNRNTDIDKAQWLKKLQESGPSREIPRVSSQMLKRVLTLNERAPHLRAATDRVTNFLRLQMRGSRHLHFPPLLIVGEPGCGKSWWAQELAQALDVSHHFQSMPNVTASFEITGSSPSWSSARPGFVVRHFLETRCATPIFIFDEIDKMNAGNYDPRPSLLGLLEPATAKHFRDEFMDMEFDVSRSLFVATANSIDDISAPLLHRFTVIHVPMPNHAQRRSIIAGFWAALRDERRDLGLPKLLTEDVVNHLAEPFESVRSLRRRILDALGEAARRRGRLQLTRFDFK